MKIDELLEKHDIDSIQKTTRITKENLKKLISKDFENLNKALVFGFLSIIEREYGPIEDLRKSWEEHFVNLEENEKLSLSIQPNRSFSRSMKPKKAFDTQLILAVVGLLVLFFVAFMAFDTNSKDNIQIPKMTVDLNDTNKTIDENHTENKEANATNLNIDQNITASALQIVPTKKLWFGIVDLTSKAKEDKIIDKPYSIDLNKSVIIATSKATFSLQNKEAKSNYNDYKRHYFKVVDGNLSEITKEQFVLLGGSKKW